MFMSKEPLIKSKHFVVLSYYQQPTNLQPTNIGVVLGYSILSCKYSIF